MANKIARNTIANTFCATDTKIIKSIFKINILSKILINLK